MKFVYLSVITFVLSFVGCRLLEQALTPGASGDSPVVEAGRGIAPYLPVTWGEGITGATLLAQNAYLLIQRMRQAKANSGA